MISMTQRLTVPPSPPRLLPPSPPDRGWLMSVPSGSNAYVSAPGGSGTVGRGLSAGNWGFSESGLGPSRGTKGTGLWPSRGRGPPMDGWGSERRDTARHGA